MSSDAAAQSLFLPRPGDGTTAEKRRDDRQKPQVTTGSHSDVERGVSDAPPSFLEVLQTFDRGRRGRKPANLPRIRDDNGSLLPRYLVEKATGQRRANGAMKLKSLRTRHYAIIAKHLEGKSLEQVAIECRVSINTVSRVLNDPLAQTVLKRVYVGREGEIHALSGKAIQAVRDGLSADAIGTRLRAVDKYAKLREVMTTEKSDESAEDVIARMLRNATIIGENIQINVGQKS